MLSKPVGPGFAKTVVKIQRTKTNLRNIAAIMLLNQYRPLFGAVFFFPGSRKNHKIPAPRPTWLLIFIECAYLLCWTAGMKVATKTAAHRHINIKACIRVMI
jgi:hypothetical protein